MTTEEASRVASEVVKGLSHNPLVLGAIIFNTLVLGAVFYTVHQAAERSEARFKMALETCPEKR